jgi:acyl-CoA thioesterase I
VLETGANDMLRGTDPASTERNIETIIQRIRQANPDAPIYLAGMLAMPNLGAEYARQFEAIYPRLAREFDLILIPFLLDGVAGERRLNQADGIHPTAEGQQVVAETVWRAIGPGLREIAATESALAPTAVRSGGDA